MPRTKVRCVRCGYTTAYLGNYKQHLERGVECNPRLSDVTPTLDNAMRMRDVQQRTRRARATPVTQTEVAGAAAQQVNVNNGNATVTQILNQTVTNQTVTNQTVTNQTVNVNVCEFGKEDLTHISNAVWEMLLQRLLVDPDEALFSTISMIRNVLVPQNLNVLFPPKTESTPTNGGDVLVRRDDGWKLAPRQWTLGHIMGDSAYALQMKADELHLRGLIPERTRARVERECDRLIDTDQQRHRSHGKTDNLMQYNAQVTEMTLKADLPPHLTRHTLPPYARTTNDIQKARFERQLSRIPFAEAAPFTEAAPSAEAARGVAQIT